MNVVHPQFLWVETLNPPPTVAHGPAGYVGRGVVYPWVCHISPHLISSWPIAFRRACNQVWHLRNAQSHATGKCKTRCPQQTFRNRLLSIDIIFYHESTSLDANLFDFLCRVSFIKDALSSSAVSWGSVVSRRNFSTSGDPSYDKSIASQVFDLLEPELKQVRLFR